MTASGTGHIPFDSSFAKLPNTFFTRQDPVPVSNPEMLLFNHKLAVELGIDPDWAQSPNGGSVFAGNQVAPASTPLAQVYAGHQFGGWNPQLGDGRAILLGEVIDNNGVRRDIQLKGSGRTPYSRGGDGRAWLGPVLREFVVSEAMHALGIPTTRALAAVASGDMVQRETALPGAVLTRVASSHIRVGTFQYFAARGDEESLQTLTDYAIARHYPNAKGALGLLKAVVANQAELIASWMSVGFIHGVMNTDNMAISGETIDYGPCAFMDDYHPDMRFSSIDHQGRYAYSNQPRVAPWNLAQLANSLLSLMGPEGAAIAAATDAIEGFSTQYEGHWLRRFGEKIGLKSATPDDRDLIERYLSGLAESGADFTNSFRDLLFDRVPENLGTWKSDWVVRRKIEGAQSLETMRRANPSFIPRNHRIEAIIQSAVGGDLEPTKTLRKILASPFDDQPDHDKYRAGPHADEVVQQTFCGT